MKLDELISALAGEIEYVCPQLDHNLSDLQTLELQAPGFMEAFDQYSGQVQRMGEAVEMVGFPGLQAVCNHVLDNTLLLAALTAAEREPVVAFLRGWPRLMVHYLHHLDDASAAAGLLDYLRGAPHPLDEESALKIMHQLGSMPLQVNFASEENKRPIVATPEDVALEIPADVDQQLFNGFLQEAPEQAQRLVELVGKMAAGQADSEDLTVAKRVAHSMKGSGAIIGLRGLAALGHHFEDIIEHFEKQGGHVAKAVADVLLDGAYCLEQMVAYVTGTDEYPQQAQLVLQSVLDLANRIDRGEDVSQSAQRAAAQAQAQAQTPASRSQLHPHTEDVFGAAAAAEQPEAAFAPAPAAGTGTGTGTGTDVAELGAAIAPAQPLPAAKRQGVAAPAAALRVGLDRIDELFRVSAEVSVHTAAMEARIKALATRAKELLEQNLRVQKRLFELETVVDVRALTMMRARSRRSEQAAFDPLEMDQYSELHSTAHALVEDASDARLISHRIEEEIAQLAGMQTRQQLLSRDLQHLVIGTRMTEVGTLESRLQRNIRTTSQVTGKMAVLVFEGGNTLIDSDVLNKLAEPLLHLLRNAVDHGLELPAERRKLGKSEVGTITLEFLRQGQQVVLRCSDDGRGLDLLAIQRRAIERGMIKPEQALSDDEISRLVLMSGFSTRDGVSEVSGRGVGLDVVSSWVEGMNGTVRISSQPGKGCTVELRFAASLSTVQALIVEVAQQRFALPSMQLEQAVPRGVGAFSQTGERLQYRHNTRIMLAVRLAELVGLPVDADKPLNEYDAVIVQVQGKVYALAVDKLIDSRELLIKNPGRYARHVRGVAGTSILGDGSVAVHMDMTQLLAGWLQTGSKISMPAAARSSIEAPKLTGVLVVDDALTVRNTLQQLLQDSGYYVKTARDGLEALSIMQTFRPHVVLTDLEMPNMNGVELTASLRSKPENKDLPIIMITSRSQDKHRELAERAGINAYITKPYNESDLVKTIRNAVAAV